MLIKSLSTYLLTILCAMIVTPAQALVPRAYVASYGNDSNISFGCNVTNPCRWFFTAVNEVQSDGEVVAIDTSNYGPVTLTRSISLTAAPGIYAGIAVGGGVTGITIATPGVNVVLRGLTINSQGGDAGILMTAGDKLAIENCVISNFSISGSPINQHGVLVQTAAKVRMVNTLIRDNDIGIQLLDGVTADISGSKFLGNSTAGIVANNSTAGTATTAAISDTLVVGSGVGIYAIVDSAAASTRIEVIRSVVSNSGVGIVAESPASVGAASVSIRKNMVTGSNQYGLWNIDGTLISYGKNTLSNNALNVVGTLTTAPPQ